MLIWVLKLCLQTRARDLANFVSELLGEERKCSMSECLISFIAQRNARCCLNRRDRYFERLVISVEALFVDRKC